MLVLHAMVFFKDQEVAVIGGGNTAVEKLYLSIFAQKFVHDVMN